MLKKTTIEELKRIDDLFVQNVDFLKEKCAGIIKNVLKGSYTQPDFIQNQQQLAKGVERLANGIIPQMNDAIREENTEKLRADLIHYYDTIEQIFTSSLHIHLGQEISYQKEYDSLKGRHLEAHQQIIKECARAKETVQQDRHMKDEVGNIGKLAESLSYMIKNLSVILGLRVKESKKEKILQLMTEEEFKKMKGLPE